MGLLEDAAAKLQQNQQKEAAEEALRIQNRPQLVQLPVFQELAALCLAYGLQPVVLNARVSYSSQKVAPVSMGWVFVASVYSNMAFTTDGHIWQNASVQKDHPQSAEDIHEVVVSELLMTEEGVTPEPRLQGPRYTPSWESLATAAAAEVLAGRAWNGYIRMNSLESSEQAAQRERDRG
jgi:hypothetical protein